jgi:hypothetical protein
VRLIREITDAAAPLADPRAARQAATIVARITLPRASACANEVEGPFGAFNLPYDERVTMRAHVNHTPFLRHSGRSVALD